MSTNKTFFGFAVADSMFSGDMEISRSQIPVETVKKIIDSGVVPCLNPSHIATINAAKARFGIEVEIPEKPPQVSLAAGDRLLVMGVRGLPRLTDRHEYTAEEIGGATFTFSLYQVTRQLTTADE